MKPRITKNKRYTRSGNNGESASERLQETIDMLQILMQKTMNQAEEGCSDQDLVDTMEKFSRASARMASLLKAHRALAGEQSVESSLQIALAEVLEELEKK